MSFLLARISDHQHGWFARVAVRGNSLLLRSYEEVDEWQCDISYPIFSLHPRQDPRVFILRSRLVG
ncbi:hypothetical protein F5Y11DRAFT_318221 [Daldinia sp. FL1419]|nr:hypothetical protein F5Y11DRAFT_318221 [Daldinia sp. FL1419]